MWKTFKSWVDSNELPWNPPLPPWSSLPRRRLRRLRSLGRAGIRARLVARQGWGPTLVQTLVWPLMSVIKAALAVRSHPIGPAAKIRLFGTLCWVQWVHNIRIGDQDQHALILPGRWRDAADYMICRESQALLDQHLQAAGPDAPPIQYKAPFAEFCAAHALPAPQLLADGIDGTCRLHAPWPAADLMFKPSCLSKGRGIECLRHDAARGVWVNATGETVTPDNLGAYAIKRIGQGGWLVQERVRNRADWKGLTAGALATVRVVTGWMPDEAEPKVICMFVRLPRRNSVVDNLSAGGIGAWIDPATNRMSSGFTYQLPYTDYPRHPDTGAPITGEEPPGLDELRALATRAHLAARAWPSVGWDLAMTDKGPMLIEANLRWAVIPRLPLAGTAYVDFMEYALHPGAKRH